MINNTIIKFLEIRDRNTFIPAVAVDMSLTGDQQADYLLKRAGYNTTRALDQKHCCVLLTSCHGGKAFYDPYDWGDRTWKIAHHYIEEHWDHLNHGDVIDVEWILGEKTSPKKSEREIEPL